MARGEVPEVPWRSFAPEFIETWEQGEHLSIIGRTGRGKTTFARYALKERARRRGAHIVVVGTKPRDATLQRWGWPIVRQWPPGYGQDQVIYWLPYPRERPEAAQRAVLRPVMVEWFNDGNRTVYFDEIAYVEEDLGLRQEVHRWWQQARSMGITMVAGTQRPRRVDRGMFSQAAWIVIFQITDAEDLKRMSEIGGADARVVRDTAQRLAPHEFLIIRSESGEMYRSQVRR